MTERDIQHLAMDLKIVVQRLAAITAETGKTISIAITPDGRVDVSTWIPRKFDESYKGSTIKTPTSVEYEDLLC